MTVALVVALSAFVALIVGSSLRPQLAAAAMPEPAAWTHRAHSVDAHAARTRPDVAFQLADDGERGFVQGSLPADKKPFRNSWMTRDRPVSWPHVSVPWGWLLLPLSFTAVSMTTAQPPPGQTCRAAMDSAAGGTDRSIQFCMLRC
ncbi:MULTISPECIES: hypothetical protein [Mycobacterium]|uniref:Uncharacterized protein n=1 Tax=Mycobacterium colombiense TaxID=339268 RepID=A0A329LSP3_9MYCO|nr:MULTISPECIES: hypothetical protein [Mycobacterium]MDM4139526.1 hypothetical protein [Mycobacterium sp. FLAC0960]RAV10408.1 hypothetical protein DQP57_13465 [Mycobacterium colombiense]